VCFNGNARAFDGDTLRVRARCDRIFTTAACGHAFFPKVGVVSSGVFDRERILKLTGAPPAANNPRRARASQVLDSTGTHRRAC